MAVKIFVTGVTGYIGGDVFYEVANAHPDYAFTCLVRDSDKGAQVASQYPNVKLIYGTLDDVEKLEEEARKADVILNCASSDHEAAAEALIRGLKAGDRSERKGCLIHTSGTGILMYKELEPLLNKQPHTLGNSSPEIYDDWDGIGAVTSLPDFAPHRKVDKMVIEADGVELKTAIVCPPTIYGVGRGPGNRRGHQVYELARCTLEQGHGIQVGEGRALWPNVHVYDMSKCYSKLLDLAMSGSSVAAWGHQGYYFTENGEHVWGEVSASVAREAVKRGLISNPEVKTVSDDDANRMTKWGSLLWGANSRCRAFRAGKILNWDPVEQSLNDEIATVVESESRRLGKSTGHAVKAAG